MRCIVTGVAGFVGSSLAERLLRDGHTVIGIDCFVEYYPRGIKTRNLASLLGNPKFTFIEKDILALDIKNEFAGAELIFHQAGQAGVRASWGSYFDTYCRHNILATQHILEGIKGQSNIKKLVFASSSSVYGDAESFPTKESTLPKPVSPYGVTKLAAEHLVTLYASQFGVPTTSLRYFTVFGPRQRPDMAFNRFMRQALTNEEITLYGDGTQSRDFTFIDDIVTANILASEHGTPGSVYNIGGGTHATVNQVLEIIASFGVNLNIKRYDRQIGDAKHTSADTSKAGVELGFIPKVNLIDGLKAEFDWMKRELGC